MSVTPRGKLRKAIRIVDYAIKTGEFDEGVGVILRLKAEHIDIQTDQAEITEMSKLLQCLNVRVLKYYGIDTGVEVKDLKPKTKRKPVTKIDSERSTVLCVFVGMVADCNASDKAEIKASIQDCTRLQFARSIGVSEVLKAGISEKKSYLVKKESVGMEWCLIRGIYHQILTYEGKRYLFVSEKYKY